MGDGGRWQPEKAKTGTRCYRWPSDTRENRESTSDPGRRVWDDQRHAMVNRGQRIRNIIKRRREVGYELLRLLAVAHKVGYCSIELRGSLQAWTLELSSWRCVHRRVWANSGRNCSCAW